VVDEFNRFQRSSESVEKVRGVTSGDVTELGQLRDAIKAMPNYQAMLSKYSLHLNLTESVMKEFDRHKLATIARLEQDMALGVDGDGREVKNVQAAITPLLRDPDLSPLDRQRLLMMCALMDGDRAGGGF
jgi:syntaxin-binding protein 1